MKSKLQFFKTINYKFRKYKKKVLTCVDSREKKAICMIYKDNLYMLIEN